METQILMKINLTPTSCTEFECSLQVRDSLSVSAKRKENNVNIVGARAQVFTLYLSPKRCGTVILSVLGVVRTKLP